MTIGLKFATLVMAVTSLIVSGILVASVRQANIISYNYLIILFITGLA